MYRCVAKSLAGFIQQLAVGYLARGYYFYVPGEVPQDKDPAKVDAKLIARYGIERSKSARYRRKQAGFANIQYLRFGRRFVLLATHGESPFFEEEAKCIHDFRERPLVVGGYSIGYRRGQGKWHPSVRIEINRYRELKALFLEMAVHRSAEEIAGKFLRLDFEPYAPVRAQLFSMVRAVNRVRKTAGFEEVSRTPFRVRRAPVRPFG
jgi:hypothetical protein